MEQTKRTPAKLALMTSMDELLHKKPFRKISVNELCQHANVSRSAFYANFEDKYQLFSCCINHKRMQLNEFAPHSPKDALVLLLDFVQQENRFFYHALDSFDEEVQEIFYQFFEKQFSRILSQKEKEGNHLCGPLEIVSAFYIGGLANTIFRWIKGNYAIPKEELAACQCSLLKDFL